MHNKKGYELVSVSSELYFFKKINTRPPTTEQKDNRVEVEEALEEIGKELSIIENLDDPEGILVYTPSQLEYKLKNLRSILTSDKEV
jgi:hypothetical protein